MKNAWVYLTALMVCLVGCSGDEFAEIIDPIWVDHGSGIVQFHTNNPDHYNYAFYHTITPATNDVYEVTAKKMSGSDNYGYGMLFCVDANDYYRFFITARQQYTIQKFISGEGAGSLIGWTNSPEIRRGYNADNKLKVVRTNSGSAATLAIYINDTLVKSVTDDIPINGTKFRLAASVDVEEKENFPYVPVEVWFKY
ncbi:MAG: hypothetical protein LBP20_00315 [Treponema sp.]|jgi:hypothetical protein|nr:hypothetical protein [Treponema sp.]